MMGCVVCFMKYKYDRSVDKMYRNKWETVSAEEGCVCWYCGKVEHEWKRRHYLGNSYSHVDYKECFFCGYRKYDEIRED